MSERKPMFQLSSLFLFFASEQNCLQRVLSPKSYLDKIKWLQGSQKQVSPARKILLKPTENLIR